MPFKTDRQRKAFFARLNSNSPETPRMIRDKNSSFKELKRRGIVVNPRGDADKDGVPNSLDCKPLDFKKQGRLHDLAINALRKKEEFVEKRREKRMKKLEDLKDKLRARKELLSKRNDVLSEKQAIINEFKREKDNIRLVTQANKEAKRELRRTSKIAGVVRATKRGVIATAKAIPKGARATTRGAKATVKFGRAANRNINKAIDISEGALKKTEKILARLI